MNITNLTALIVYYIIKNDIKHYSNEFIHYIIIKYKHIPQDLLIKCYNNIYNIITNVYLDDNKNTLNNTLDYYQTSLSSKFKIIDDYLPSKNDYG